MALAQADLIVDPWKRVLAGKAPAPAVPTPRQAPRPQRADNGWLDDGERAAAAPKPVVEPWAPVEMLPDPWATPAPAPPAAAPPPRAPEPATAEAPHPLHPSNWARVVPEIIDPWGPGRLAVYRDPLIVDPWQE